MAITQKTLRPRKKCKKKKKKILFQEGVPYVRWVAVLDSTGHPVNKFTAVSTHKLAALGSTPQDMQWAENCQAKYMAAQNEMQCG